MIRVGNSTNRDDNVNDLQETQIISDTQRNQCIKRKGKAKKYVGVHSNDIVGFVSRPLERSSSGFVANYSIIYKMVVCTLRLNGDQDVYCEGFI